MPNLEGVKPGDVLLHTSENRRRDSTVPPKEVTVHKVGRSLVHILRFPDSSNSGTDSYRIENGYGSDLRSGRLWKPEDWEMEKERPGLEDALRKHGIEVYRGGPKSIPVLRKLLAVMEEAED